MAGALSSFVQIRIVYRSAAEIVGPRARASSDLQVLGPLVPGAPMEVRIPAGHQGTERVARGGEDEQDRQDALYLGTVQVHVSNRRLGGVGRVLAGFADAGGVQHARWVAFQSH